MHVGPKSDFEKIALMQYNTGTFGLILGGVVALAAMIFIFSGGALGGKTTVNGDEDLAPVAMGNE